MFYLQKNQYAPPATAVPKKAGSCLYPDALQGE